MDDPCRCDLDYSSIIKHYALKLVKIERLKSADFFQDNGFPLAVLAVTNHYPYPRLHRHEFHELVLITHGHGRHRSENDDYPISAGDVFLLHGNMQHGYADVDHLNLVNILFRPRQLGLPLADLGDMPGFQLLFHLEPHLRQESKFRDRLHLTTEQLAEAERLVAQLDQELRKRAPGYRFAARTHLMQLIAFLSRCYSNAKRPANEGLLRLGEVLSYLECHYREPITVKDLLPIAHMSQSTLMRTFQRVFQHSPIDYLIRLRVEKACAMLADPELRITDVALACGFNDSNYFTRQFRRVTGHSPREHRRAQLKSQAGSMASAPQTSRPSEFQNSKSLQALAASKLEMAAGSPSDN